MPADKGQVRTNPLVKFVSHLGPLRVMLLCLAVITVIFAPQPGTPAVYQGWSFFTTVLAPVLAPLIFMVLMLDTMMGGILMSGKEGVGRKPYRTIIITNLLLALAFLLYWLPYYLALGE